MSDDGNIHGYYASAEGIRVKVMEESVAWSQYRTEIRKEGRVSGCANCMNRSQYSYFIYLVLRLPIKP